MKVISNQLNFEELLACTTYQEKSKIVLWHNEKEVSNLNFKLKNTTVKFTPEKYPKLVVQLNESLDKFTEFEESLKDIQKFIKNGCISVKINDAQKRDLKNIKTGDELDLIIKFNNIWEINDKYFVSLQLVQFKQSKKQEFL